MWLLLFLLLVLSWPAAAQAPASSPLSVADLAEHMEAASATLADLRERLDAADRDDELVHQRLQELARDLDERQETTTRLLAESPSLELLRHLDGDWRYHAEALPAWRRVVTLRADQLEAAMTQLKQLQATSTRMQASAVQAPPDVQEGLRRLFDDLASSREAAQRAQAAGLERQRELEAQEARVTLALQSLEQARTARVGHLLERDAPPLWRAQRGAPAAAWRQISENLAMHLQATLTFVSDRRYDLTAQLALYLGLVLALKRTTRGLRSWSPEDPQLRRALAILDSPWMAALVMSTLLSRALYLHAPRLFRVAQILLGLTATVVILRPLVSRRTTALLAALVACLGLDVLQFLCSNVQLLGRVLFLVEMAGAWAFLTGFAWATRRSHPRASGLSLLGALVLVPTLAASLLGYLSLAEYVGNSLMRCSYVALVIYAGVQVADALLVAGMRLRPFNLLGSVQRHPGLLYGRLRPLLYLAAVLVWLLIALDITGTSQSLQATLERVVHMELHPGTLPITLGQVLAAVATLAVALVLSGFVRFLLAEEVYPRAGVPRGVSYAVSTVLHYTLLSLAALVALAELGLDVGKMTILAGGISVGLGFGLQNIVNNFVSGLILLFERPVRVGDAIEVGKEQGELVRVGLRASLLRTGDGSDIIVPNSKLISEQVTNWTLSGEQRRLRIDLAVAYGSPPEQVMATLTQVAAAHPAVLPEPAPRALFRGLGKSSLSFQLQAWTHGCLEQVQSELLVTLVASLREEGIAIAAP